jgi:hypothetical protein
MPSHSDPELEVLGLSLRPSSDRYEADDPRFREQVSQLVRDLRHEAGQVRLDATPEPGTKGSTVEGVILALGSSGALHVALDMFRSWLRRDRCRRLEVTWSSGGVSEQVVLTADAIDRDSFVALSKLALRFNR